MNQIGNARSLPFSPFAPQMKIPSDIIFLKHNFPRIIEAVNCAESKIDLECYMAIDEPIAADARGWFSISSFAISPFFAAKKSVIFCKVNFLKRKIKTSSHLAEWVLANQWVRFASRSRMFCRHVRLPHKNHLLKSSPRLIGPDCLHWK